MIEMDGRRRVDPLPRTAWLFMLVVGGLLLLWLGMAIRNDLTYHPFPIRNAGISADGLTVSMGGPCSDQTRVTVTETAETVTVTAAVFGDQSGADGCATGLTATLDLPLGDRRLIDGSTGKIVRVG